MQTETGYLTARDVADLLGVHVVTVRNWLRAGEMRGTAFSGRTGWRVRREDVEAFIRAKQNTVPGWSGEAEAVR